jgi:transposase-like protein
MLCGPFRVVTAEEEDACVRRCVMEGLSIRQTARLMKVGRGRIRAIADGNQLEHIPAGRLR